MVLKFNTQQMALVCYVSFFSFSLSRFVGQRAGFFSSNFFKKFFDIFLFDVILNNHYGNLITYDI